MKLKGTEFQIKVWKEILKIPKGFTKTYKEIACDLNKPKCARAVANACGKNPYVPIIPCHRVIRSDGHLGGYSGKGGIEMKKKMLISEGFFNFKDHYIKWIIYLVVIFHNKILKTGLKRWMKV